jgi:hypothetical protein
MKTYTKPIVTVIKAAVAAIQGQPPGSKLGIVLEAIGVRTHETAPAYEADE